MKHKAFCIDCNDYVDYHINERKLTGWADCVSFEYPEMICICDHCGSAIDVPDIGSKNLRSFYDAKKKAMHLLTSDEIVAIRSKLNLSAERFGRLLGLGAKTITRYENGAIQTRANDYLIRLASISENAKLLESFSLLNAPSSESN